MRFGFTMISAAFVGVMAIVHPSPAKALVARVFSTPEKVAHADCVVVGKVIAIEEKTIEAPPFPGAQEKVAYTIANIKIQEGLFGAKGLTNIRVGFIPTPEALAGGPGVRPIRRNLNINLIKDQEGCFFLNPHPSGDFYTINMTCAPLDKTAEDYAKQLELAKQCAKIIAEPVASLKAKKAADRLLAASILVSRYRSVRQPSSREPKQAPIPTEESKLILNALVEANWAENNPRAMQSPVMLFNLLGLTAKDGFVHPKPAPGENYGTLLQKAAKDWLRRHADTYRIRMYVPDTGE